MVRPFASRLLPLLYPHPMTANPQHLAAASIDGRTTGDLRDGSWPLAGTNRVRCVKVRKRDAFPPVATCGSSRGRVDAPVTGVASLRSITTSTESLRHPPFNNATARPSAEPTAADSGVFGAVGQQFDAHRGALSRWVRDDSPSHRRQQTTDRVIAPQRHRSQRRYAIRRGVQAQLGQQHPAQSQSLKPVDDCHSEFPAHRIRLVPRVPRHSDRIVAGQGDDSHPIDRVDVHQLLSYRFGQASHPGEEPHVSRVGRQLGESAIQQWCVGRLSKS